LQCLGRAKLNIRAHSQSETCVYAQLSLDLFHVRRLAERYPDWVRERRRRARTFWVTEGPEGDESSDVFVFTGYSIDGIRTQRFHVDPRASEGQPGVTADDLW